MAAGSPRHQHQPPPSRSHQAQHLLGEFVVVSAILCRSSLAPHMCFPYCSARGVTAAGGPTPLATLLYPSGSGILVRSPGLGIRAGTMQSVSRRTEAVTLARLLLDGPGTAEARLSFRRSLPVKAVPHATPSSSSDLAYRPSSDVIIAWARVSSWLHVRARLRDRRASSARLSPSARALSLLAGCGCGLAGGLRSGTSSGHHGQKIRAACGRKTPLREDQFSDLAERRARFAAFSRLINRLDV